MNIAELPHKITKLCNKCEKETIHRRTKDGRSERLLYLCTICTENRSKKHRHAHWLRYIAQKANARKRQNSELMTEEILEQLWKKQYGKCALTGIKMETSGGYNAASLDRVDSSKGYTTGNIRLVVWLVNHVRGDLTDTKFLNLCKQICLKNEINLDFAHSMFQDTIIRERYDYGL